MQDGNASGSGSGRALATKIAAKRESATATSLASLAVETMNLWITCSEVCPGKAGMFSRRQSCRGKSQSPVVWRAASLRLKRYGEKALEESVARADELFAEQDHDGAAVWRRIIDAVGQLANMKPSGRPH